MYKGVTTLGMGNYCAIFSPTEQFGDGFSRGIQHLFYEDYGKDLINMAITVNRFDKGFVEYADLHYDGCSAPGLIPVDKEGSSELYDVYTEYDSKNSVRRKTIAYALENSLVMEEELQNSAYEDKEITQYAYVFFTNDSEGFARYDKERRCIIWTNSIKSKNLIIGLQETVENVILSKEPKYSSIITLQKILADSYMEEKEGVKGADGISCALGRKTYLKPGQKKIFRWYIIPCTEIQDGLTLLDSIRKTDSRAEAQKIYTEFFEKSTIKKFTNDSIKNAYYRNLLAIKAANLKGMVPADVIGYYNSQNGTPSIYVRDSLMVARAFISSGYLEEARQIITRIANLPLKEKGEFYQRYDAFGNQSEGRNNDIEHQMDSNGYFLSLIYQYFERTGELLASLQMIEDIVECIQRNQTYNGLVGPEGGVNEGVYGAAYITSTNMFIAGGLHHTTQLLECILKSGSLEFSQIDDIKIHSLKKQIDNILEHLEHALLEK